MGIHPVIVNISKSYIFFKRDVTALGERLMGQQDIAIKENSLLWIKIND